MAPIKRPIEERFWEKVDKRGPDECWNWLASKTKLGYGKLGTASNQFILAHRYSYELHKEPIPAKLFIRHSCHNTSCVNPNHLSTGTHQDNSDDMVNAGRSLKGKKHYAFGQKFSKEIRDKMSNAHSGEKSCLFGKFGEDHPMFGYKHSKEECQARSIRHRGENASGAKLSEEQVKHLRELYATGLYSQVELAKLFSISTTNTYNIISRKRWKHI